MLDAVLPYTASPRSAGVGVPGLGAGGDHAVLGRGGQEGRQARGGGEHLPVVPVRRVHRSRPDKYLCCVNKYFLH